MAEQTISEAFDLIRQYAEREGWIPVGWRDWRVGPWRIRVNGTSEARENVPPFHALVENEDYVGLMLIHPFGGSKMGSQRVEDEFIAAMRAEVSR